MIIFLHIIYMIILYIFIFVVNYRCEFINQGSEELEIFFDNPYEDTLYNLLCDLEEKYNPDKIINY